MRPVTSGGKTAPYRSRAPSRVRWRRYSSSVENPGGRSKFGSSGLPYQLPEEFIGAYNLGFMFLPKYRAWVILASLIVCFGTWYVIERTKLGSYLRAGTENAALVQAFGGTSAAIGTALCSGPPASRVGMQHFRH